LRASTQRPFWQLLLRHSVPELHLPPFAFKVVVVVVAVAVVVVAVHAPLPRMWPLEHFAQLPLPSQLVHSLGLPFVPQHLPFLHEPPVHSLSPNVHDPPSAFFFTHAEFERMYPLAHESQWPFELHLAQPAAWPLSPQHFPPLHV